MGHKVFVVFLEMAHIQVHYPLHLANKPSTNHHGNPIQFWHQRNNYKLDFLMDHTNSVHRNLDWFDFSSTLSISNSKLDESEGEGSKISEVSSRIVRVHKFIGVLI